MQTYNPRKKKNFSVELLYENNKFATWNEINIDKILDKMLKKKTWEGIRGMWIVDV